MGSVSACCESGFYDGVVITEVTPDYYAQGNNPVSFLVRGQGFGTIEKELIGVIAYSNDDPLRFQQSTDSRHLYDVVVENDGEMMLTHQGTSSPSGYSYLGAILEKESRKPVWVNNSRPIP